MGDKFPTQGVDGTGDFHLVILLVLVLVQLDLTGVDKNKALAIVIAIIAGPLIHS